MAKGQRYCHRCGKPCGRGKLICQECEARWTGTHYAEEPVVDGDAMLKRLPGSFETGKRR
jgi:hypothetical protein